MRTMGQPLTFSFPVNGWAHNASGWNGGSVLVVVCGTASDPSGVGSVGVAVRMTRCFATRAVVTP